MLLELPLLIGEVGLIIDTFSDPAALDLEEGRPGAAVFEAGLDLMAIGAAREAGVGRDSDKRDLDALD